MGARNGVKAAKKLALRPGRLLQYDIFKLRNPLYIFFVYLCKVVLLAIDLFPLCHRHSRHLPPDAFQSSSPVVSTSEYVLVSYF